MRNVTWKDIVEVVGIAAIVASLIFVGMQMRQAQRIAVADSYQQQVAAAQADSELAFMYSEFVAKANRGEVLTAAESFALNEYVATNWRSEFYSKRRSAFLDRRVTGPVARYSDFLCKNPGLREIWESQAEGLRAYSPGSPLGIFVSEVDSAIDIRCGQ
jgi:hypothetical protein